MNECKCKNNECRKSYMQFESKALENNKYCSVVCEVKNRHQLDLFKIDVKEV